MVYVQLEACVFPGIQFYVLEYLDVLYDRCLAYSGFVG